MLKSLIPSKHVLIGGVIGGLVAIALANNISFIGNLVRPRQATKA